MREVSEIGKQHNNLIEVNQRLVVKSPVDGFVRNMQAFTIGGVFRSGQDLLDIVPKDEELLIEVKIEPKDRDIVKEKQEVMVNFNSLQSKTTPRLKGALIYIDSDITKEQNGKTYYIGRIAIAKDELGKIKNLELHPGMPVDAFILVNKKSFATILFSPLLQQLARAFRDA
jgi:HlyD family type I secretion membrane fusion protein